MIWTCLDSLIVLAAFAVVYIIPPLLVTRRLLPLTDRLSLVIVSAGLGIASQALLGFAWNHLVAREPRIECLVYFFGWAAASIIALRARAHSSHPGFGTVPTFSLSTMLLPLIVIAGMALRNIDPLAHASLGQSDAYTHLQFLRDVIARGEIRNIVYPPGYAWTLALPAMILNLDAYLVARYVGPFFAVLLVGTLIMLGRRHSHMAGLFAGFLAALCPLFYPLIKTGIGAFANQMGLVLLPLALLLYLIEARLLFTLILLGLTVSVPLFVFTLALLVLLHQLLRCSVVRLLGGKSRHLPSATHQLINSTTILLLSFLLALLLAGYHFLTPGKRHVNATATLVTGIQSPSLKKLSLAHQTPSFSQKIKANPAGKLALDLLTIKRFGLGNTPMNLAILALGGLFATILIAGIRQRSPDQGEQRDGAAHHADFLKLVGCWGLLTTLQAATGFLEFSLYQRSGWVLMEALALAGGVTLAWFYELERMQRITQPMIMLFLAACVILAFWMPPQHRCVTSGAENELSTLLRELSSSRLETLRLRGPLALERFEPSPLIARAAGAAKLTILSRRYTLSHADQGNIADVLPDPAAGISQIPVEMDSQLTPPSDHFLCLIDRASALPDMGLLNRISPELTQSLAGYQDRLYKPNEVILSFLERLPADMWRITREERGTNLTICYVERIKDAPR